MDKSIVKAASQALKADSLDDLVRMSNAANVFMLLDCSGSMATYMRNGKQRIAGLRQVVTDSQKEKKVPMIAFGPLSSDMTSVFFTETVPDPAGGTPLAAAITFARANGAGRLVVVSDGWPDEQGAAMDAAKAFGGRIDVVFVGDPNDPGSLFLDNLARSTGGERFTGDLSEPKELTGAVIGLLNGDVADEDDEDDDGFELEQEDDTDDEDEDDDEDDDEDR